MYYSCNTSTFQGVSNGILHHLWVSIGPPFEGPGRSKMQQFLCFSANHCAFLGFYGLPRGIPSNGQMSNCPTFPEPKGITWPFSGSGVLRVLRARRSSGRQSLLHLWRIQLGARIVFRTLRNSEGLVANPNEKPQIFPREDLFVLLLLCDRVQPPRGDIMDRICATKHDMGMDGLDVKI